MASPTRTSICRTLLTTLDKGTQLAFERRGSESDWNDLYKAWELFKDLTKGDRAIFHNDEISLAGKLEHRMRVLGRYHGPQEG